jgi:hypothetical protein
MTEGSFELDGKVLRAIQLAADDFLPPSRENAPCWATQAAHTYRVLRQGEVLFVRINENPSACGRELPALHSGAQYAISLDGRILKRQLDGESDGMAPGDPASTPPGVEAEPGVIPDDEPQTTSPIQSENSDNQPLPNPLEHSRGADSTHTSGLTTGDTNNPSTRPFIPKPAAKDERHQ